MKAMRDLFGYDDAIHQSIEDDIAKLQRTPRRLSRSLHPETSKEAARQIESDLPRLHRRVLDLIREHPGRTANELAAIAQDRDVRRVGRRLSELEEMVMIRRCASRRCEITGHTAATWEPVQ